MAALLLCVAATLQCAQDARPLGPQGTLAESTAAPQPIPILSPSSPQIAQGTAQQFTVHSLDAASRMQDVTSLVSWRLTQEGGAALPAPTDGLVELAAPGRYQVSAEYMDQRVDSVLVVTAATLKSLDVTPSTAAVAKGLSQQFTATASFSDGTTQDVTASSAWSVKDTIGSGVAAVTTRGLATGKQVGKARVSARYKTLTTPATLTVTDASLQSLTISPTGATVAKGTAQRYTAQGTFSDGTVQDLSTTVDWAVADLMGSGVASIDGLGNAVGLAEGSATVSAAYLDQLAETTLAVSPAVVTGLAISPTAPAIRRGDTVQFTATALLSDGSKQDVSMMSAWTATDVSGSGVASINGNGLAKANAVGSATIKCLFRGYSAAAPLNVFPPALTAVAITPASVSVAKGLSQAFSLLATYSDGTSMAVTTSAIWNIADVMGTDVATLSAGGVAQTRHEGSARVSAAYQGKSATASLTVTAATLVSIAISPSPVLVDVAATQALTAQGVYTDGSTADLTMRVSWSVTDIAPGSGVASISTGGLLTGKSKGQATVAATYAGVRAEALAIVGGIRVASLFCSTDATVQSDVKQKLEGLHLFALVDNIDMGAAPPALMTLQKYAAVLVWADLSRGGCSDSSGTGDVLAQYADGGGGVVVMNPYYIGNTYSNVYSANWDSYVLINNGGMTYVATSSLGTVDSTHAVMRGISKITTSGSRCYQRASASGPAIRSGASIIATWSDGNGMVVAGMPKGKPRVDINLYPASADVGTSGCYDSTSDVPKLLGNALLWVAGR